MRGIALWPDGSRCATASRNSSQVYLVDADGQYLLAYPFGTEAAEIVADLEKNLFFLVRNQAGDVSWAFPVTSDATPHRLTFSTGEHTFAA